MGCEKLPYEINPVLQYLKTAFVSESIMTQETKDESLKHIGNNTLLYLIGTGVSILFVVISRIILAKFWTEAQFGVYSLALVVLNMGVILASLGLQDGTSRFVAYYSGKGEPQKAILAATSSLLLAGSAGIILGIILLFSSRAVALNIFHNVAIDTPLRIMAICIPFLTLINAFIAISRGYSRIREKVFFQDIFINVFFCLLLLPVSFFTTSFTWVFFAYLMTIIILLYRSWNLHGQ